MTPALCLMYEKAALNYLAVKLGNFSRLFERSEATQNDFIAKPTWIASLRSQRRGFYYKSTLFLSG